jgi:hypothetical protein
MEGEEEGAEAYLCVVDGMCLIQFSMRCNIASASSLTPGSPQPTPSVLLVWADPFLNAIRVLGTATQRRLVLNALGMPTYAHRRTMRAYIRVYMHGSRILWPSERVCVVQLKAQARTCAPTIE